MSTIIYACDIGSTVQGRFAWARTSTDDEEISTSSDIARLVQRLAEDFHAGSKIALGFEAPLFIPVPPAVANLSRARQGEGNRSWAAPAGSAVATLGIHQSAWILRSLRETLLGVEITLDWQAWQHPTTPSKLLCWEAFVSGAAHQDEHCSDAATAVHSFRENLLNSQLGSDVRTDHPFSLIGAVALWSGWTDDSTVLHKAALVIKPATPYLGPRKAV